MVHGGLPGRGRSGHLRQRRQGHRSLRRTLITPAPFDAFLNGDDAALTAEQQRGLALFIDKGCSTCHAGTNFGGEGCLPFGLIEKPGADVLPEKDKGRFAVTNTADGSYVFRAAPLRNVALTAPVLAFWEGMGPEAGHGRHGHRATG